MEPSIQSGDLIIIQRFSKIFNNLDEGDVVITKSPVEHKQFILKRIKAMDGQTIRRGIKFQTVSVICT